VTRLANLAAALLLLAACGRGDGDAPAAPERKTVPGVETVVAETARVRDVVRVPGTVAPEGLTNEARDARNDLVGAEARLRLASQQVTRLQALAQGAVAPRKELEAALAEEASARAAYERARQVVAGLGGIPEPDGGARGTTFVVARVPQETIGAITPGAAVAIVADAFDHATFTGTVDGTASYVDPATRTAPVRIRVDDPAHRLLPGMTASVAIDAGTSHDAVVVPEVAVVYDDRQALVFVDDGHGGFKSTPVAVALVRDGRAALTSGLAAGTRVATTGAASLLSASRLGAADGG
jgi:membrane fusion protein, copper/silver efflux system